MAIDWTEHAYLCCIRRMARLTGPYGDYTLAGGQTAAAQGLNQAWGGCKRSRKRLHNP